MIKLQITTLLCSLILLIGCHDDTSNPDGLTLSESKITVAGEASQAQVKITYHSTWTASCNSAWCVVDRPNGSGDYTLTLKVSDNPTMQPRTAIVTIQTQKEKKTIALTQTSAQISEGYTYQIPVIFHVLYKDRNNHTQYIEPKRITEVLAQMNELYRASATSVDMQVQFVLTTTDPTGKTLEEPGVIRKQINEAQIDAVKFMNDKNTQYAKWTWDPNQYVNIMLYEFKLLNGNQTLLGISHLPYTSKNNPLAGLEQAGSDQPLASDFSYPHCLSINNQFIYTPKSESSNIICTLAHEIGHYLGLHHTFSEDAQDQMVGCIDSDYCLDTPTYDREAYEEWLQTITQDESDPILAQRTSCDGTKFTSRNILDYAFGESNQFTNDQQKRVHHVLTTGVPIPGPKVGLRPRTRAETGPILWPVRAIP